MQDSLELDCAKASQWIHQGQLDKAWALLGSLAEMNPEHTVVRRLQGIVLTAADQHIQALTYYRAALALAPHDGVTLAAAGWSLQLLGQLPLAVQHYRAALAEQCAKPLRVGTPPRKKFDSTRAEARLWSVLVELARVGIHAFATSGTLLGLVREGRLLHFDKDLDIGLPFAEIEAAATYLLQRGWYRATASLNMINPVMLHDGQGLSLDLCGFKVEPESGITLGGFWLKDAPASWQRVTEYPTLNLHQQHRPEGAIWSVTAPEIWLATLYGPDWRIPDPNFDTVIAAHNLRGFSLLTQCYAFSRIYECWLQGRLHKAQALVAHSLRHLPEDALLLQIQQLLARQMGELARPSQEALNRG